MYPLPVDGPSAHHPNPNPIMSQGEQRQQANETGRRQGCACCPSSRRVGKGGIGREAGQARPVPSPIRVSIACTHEVCFLTPPFAPPLAGISSWRRRAARCAPLRIRTELSSSRAAASASGSGWGCLGARDKHFQFNVSAHADARRCLAHGTAVCARVFSNCPIKMGSAVTFSSSCACWSAAFVAYVKLCKPRSRVLICGTARLAPGHHVKTQNFASRMCGSGIESDIDLGRF